MLSSRGLESFYRLKAAFNKIMKIRNIKTTLKNIKITSNNTKSYQNII